MLSTIDICKAVYIRGIVIINCTFKNGTIEDSTYNTLGTIPAKYSPNNSTNAVYFRGAVTGMIASYSGRILGGTDNTKIQGYHNSTYMYSQINAGATHISICYFCKI